MLRTKRFGPVRVAIGFKQHKLRRQRLHIGLAPFAFKHTLVHRKIAVRLACPVQLVRRARKPVKNAGARVNAAGLFQNIKHVRSRMNSVKGKHFAAFVRAGLSNEAKRLKLSRTGCHTAWRKIEPNLAH